METVVETTTTQKENEIVNVSPEKSPDNESNKTKQGKYSCTKCEMSFALKVDLKVSI